jgi:CheY-like chemotaxis protein
LNSEDIKILLADDDEDDCFFFEEAVEALPLITQLTTVHDGDQLMQLLKKESDRLPNMLFLDLNMPRKNGFKCLEEIKSDKKLMHIPVIILSTSFDQSIVDLLYKTGAQYYICKPTKFSSLINVIHQVIRFITEKKFSQPPREKFVLSNLKTILL